MAYVPPTIETLGSLKELTGGSLDKVGSSADFLTALVSELDGDFVPDP